MSRSVSIQSPINWASPLNRGLLRWWTCLPNQSRWNPFRELTRRSHMTITGASAFGNRGRVGGFGCYQFDGVNDYGQTAAIDLSGVNTITLAMWVYWDSFATFDIMVETSADYNSNTGAFVVAPLIAASQWDVGIRTGAGTYNYCHFTRPSLAAWHQFTFCLNRGGGANQITAVYVDGVSQSLTYDFTDTTGTGGFGNYAWNFMSRNGTTFFGAGRLDDVRLYNRLLTATEASALYYASRRGYPQELRWSRGAEITAEEVAATAAFNYYNRRRRNA